MVILPPGLRDKRNEAGQAHTFAQMFADLQGGLNRRQLKNLHGGFNPGGFNGHFAQMGLTNRQQRLIASLYGAGAFNSGGITQDIFSQLLNGQGQVQQGGPIPRDPNGGYPIPGHDGGRPPLHPPAHPGQPGGYTQVPHPGGFSPPPPPPPPHGGHGPMQQNPFQQFQNQQGQQNRFQQFQPGMGGRPNFRQMFLQRAMRQRPVAR